MLFPALDDDPNLKFMLFVFESLRRSILIYLYLLIFRPLDCCTFKFGVL